MDNGTDKEQWELKVFGQSLTATKIAILATVTSTVVGFLWAGFQVWHKIDSYEAPDMESFDKRLAIVEETTNKTNDYTRDIKNDLKNDIRKLEKVVEQIERDGKQLSRDTDKSIREIRNEYKEAVKEALHNPMNQR